MWLLHVWGAQITKDKIKDNGDTISKLHKESLAELKGMAH